MSKLLGLMSDSDINYSFIKSRVARLFSKWSLGIEEFQRRVPELWSRSQLNVSNFFNKTKRFLGDSLLRLS